MSQDKKLLAMIRETQHSDPDAEGTITSRELAELMGGVSRDRALQAIHDLVGAGKLAPERIGRRNIQGDVQRVAGYRVVEE